VRALLLLPVLAVLALGTALRPSTAAPSHTFRIADLTPTSSFNDGTLRAAGPLSRLAGARWGGPVTAADGESVTVYLSDAYPVDPAVQLEAANFLTQLYHGAELSSLSLYLAPLTEVQSICGLGTGGCYGRDQIVAPGEDLPDGTSAENVLAHEYGHHVAGNRDNAPWAAIDWGTKRWATFAQICPREATGTAFPGDEATNYRLNPGEGFAEVYRLLNFQKQAWSTWIPTAWRIVDQSFYPDANALEAAKEDVLQPWSGPQKKVWTARLRNVARKGRPPRVPRVRTAIATPLDGDLTVRLLRAPAGATISLQNPTGKSVLPAARNVLRTTACGQRLYVLSVRGKKPGAFAVSISTP